jgi:hypothetical protein
MIRFSSLLRVGLLAIAVTVGVPTAAAQMLPDDPVGNGPAPLSSGEVSDAEIESAAEIVVTMEVQRRQLVQKYGNPGELTRAQRRKVQREIMRERQALMQKKTLEEDLDAGRLELIMISARRDSTLHDRVRTAIEKKKREKQDELTKAQGASGQ